MDLIINDQIIDTPIPVILNKIRIATGNYYFRDVIDKGDSLMITCPYHKDGLESKPSASIVNSTKADVPYGTFHCFACGKSGSLMQLVNHCFNQEGDFGKQWLLDNCETTLVEETFDVASIIDKLSLTSEGDELNSCEILDEAVLNKYRYDDPDAWNYLLNKRHLIPEVIKYFQIGYNPVHHSVTFPVRDVDGNLVSVMEREILTKKFYIPKLSTKPVYLLDVAKNYHTVYVAESQINALTLWSWGYPAIALFGTGSKPQYEILNSLTSSNITSYVLCFDGDYAGYLGRNKFIKNVNSDGKFFSYKEIPRGKDVNDLTKEQFDNLILKFT